MRVLIVNCVYDPEPVVSAEIAKSIAEKLAEKCNQITVICPYPSRPYGFKFQQNFINKNEFNESEFKPNLKVIRLASLISPKSILLGRFIEGISFGWQSFKYIINNASKFDKVYMNTWPLFGQLGVALACKYAKIPYIVHVQDIYPESLVNKLPGFLTIFFLKLLMPIEKYVVRNAYKIVVISDYMRDKIFSRGEILKEKISIVNNWQDESIFDNENFDTIENDKLTFMYLGNNGPVANIPFVIMSFYEANINAKLIIAGTGTKRKYSEDLVNSLSIKNIQFLDVPAGQLVKTQAFADILILSTIKNGAKTSIPSKLPSYMFSKKPILALIDKNTDTYNAIIESKCGWVVNPDDKKKIIEKFKDLVNIQQSDLIAKGLNGYNYAKENFSKKKNLDKIISIILD